MFAPISLVVRRRSSIAALAIALATPGFANAQAGDVAAAESLFREGKKLLDSGDYAQACPKLAESHRLDPATGTLLALAFCHESEGKNASAWAEYVDAGARSRREGRSDREKAARARAAALQPKLSKLTISVPAEATVEGLDIRRDGVAIGAGAWGTAMAIDGGEHSVEATATGKKPWHITVSIRPSGDSQTITVPVLEDDPSFWENAPTQGASPGIAPIISKEERGTPRSSPLAIAGLATAGVGVVAIGTGVFFGIRAIGKNNDSESGCAGDVCYDPAAKQARLDALAAANTATVAFIAGGVLAGAGLTMFFLGRQTARPAEPTAFSWQIAPVADAREVGCVLSGGF